MKNLLLLGLFIFSLNLFSFSQTDTLISNDSILLGPKKGFPLTYQGETLNTKRLSQLFADNPGAKMEFDIAKTNQTFGMILGGAGGFMLGWSLGVAATGGTPNWILAGAGVACFIGSIPLNSAFKKRTLNAVEIYNEGLMHKESVGVKLDIGGTQNGIGMVLRF